MPATSLSLAGIGTPEWKTFGMLWWGQDSGSAQLPLVWPFHSLPPSFLIQETRQKTISGVVVREGNVSGDMECPNSRPEHTAA